MTIGVAIVGFGHIARHAHLPAITANPNLRLVAVATPGADPQIGVPWFSEVEVMLDAVSDAIDAIVVCTPPDARFKVASAAIARGKAVLLEKPPAATLGEAEALVAMASAAETILFTAWHSQHAPAVAVVQALLADDGVGSLNIEWREDVRQWHPGQSWIWEPGGHGVFDAAINALSIATRILPSALLLQSATLYYPANRQSPIAADLRFNGDDHSATVDWRNTGNPCWRITIQTFGSRTIVIDKGGHALRDNGLPVMLSDEGEYDALYRHFVALINIGQSDVELAPLRIVADAFLIGHHATVAPFA